MSVRLRTGGSLLDTPSSIKKWKEEFFYASGELEFYFAKVDRDDVVPKLYHSLSK